MNLNDLRREYSRESLTDDSVSACPWDQFETWFQQATKAQLLEPNAMVLSTVSPQGQPTSRSVLLKYVDRSGLVFFTNYLSRKGQQMAENTNVAVLFPWYELQRQVEINGAVEKISKSESIKYFAMRPRGSQLGAWVSAQSSVVSSKTILLNKLKKFRDQFLKTDVPMPEQWGGYRIIPHRFEFWQGGKNRLHDRIEYTLDEQTTSWSHQRLEP